MSLCNTTILEYDITILTHYLRYIRIYVFGSWLRDPTQADDIDIIVVSPAFANMVYIKRKQLVLSVIQRSGLRVDPICMTSAEFNQSLKSTSDFAGTVLASLTLIYDRRWKP